MVELQLQITEMVKVRENMGAHRGYNLFRAASEVLEAVGENLEEEKSAAEEETSDTELARVQPETPEEAVMRLEARVAEQHNEMARLSAEVSRLQAAHTDAMPRPSHADATSHAEGSVGQLEEALSGAVNKCMAAQADALEGALQEVLSETVPKALRSLCGGSTTQSADPVDFLISELQKYRGRAAT